MFSFGLGGYIHCIIVYKVNIISLNKSILNISIQKISFFFFLNKLFFNNILKKNRSDERIEFFFYYQKCLISIDENFENFKEAGFSAISFI